MHYTHKHEFALYYEALGEPRVGTILTLIDDSVVHRIVHVLRLSCDNEFILFNQTIHCVCCIESVAKKSVFARVIQIVNNTVYAPRISVALALLKREALDDAVHDLATLGVNDIYLFISSKVQRSWGGIAEYSRLQRCIVSAAEQSKCFAFPMLHEPVLFDQLLQQCDSALHILCSGDGQPIASVLQKPHDIIWVMIGPEGDLTDDEKQRIGASGYISCRLTPTVLRSEHAAALAAGFIRSFF